MMTLGFDPVRTNALSARTRAAIDELSAIRSSDPAAVDALRVVALTEHNLRTSWLPLLDRIASTDVFSGWNRIDAAVASARWDGVVEALLLARLRRRAGAVRHGLDGRPLPGDLTGDWLPPLLDAVRRRLEQHPDFAAALRRLVADEPSAAWLLHSDELDATLRADVLIVLLGTVGRVHGTEWESVAGAADRLMEGLLTRPDEALRVLTDRTALTLLAEWPPLDQGVVAEFVHIALTGAVRARPGLHADAVDVLRSLIVLANGERLDQVGFLPGMSVGMASAIGAYAPSFVDTVRLESGTVTVRRSGVDGPLDTTLGTYRELTEFFGAVMRDDVTAQEILGAELAAMARLAVLGGDGVPPTVRLDTVAELAQLLQHAASNENDEARLAAAARRAGALDASTLFGFTTSALFLATRGGHPVAAFLLDRGVKDLVDMAARPPETVPPVPIDLATATHQMIVTAVLGRLATDPELRRRGGVGGTAADWDAIGSQLEELAELAADGDRPAEVDRRLHQLEAEARDLGAGDHLDDLLRIPAVHDLTSTTARR